MPARLPQHQPHKHTLPTYGATLRYSEPENASAPLDKKGKKLVQQVIGTFPVDATMLTALSAIASDQATPTENTMDKIRTFLEYASTNKEAVVKYSKSDTVLAAHSDASHLSEPKTRSRAGGHFFMTDNAENPANLRC